MDTKIIMINNHLDTLETVIVPENCTLSSLKCEEDERQWEELISKSFDFECKIDKHLKCEEIYSPERVFILKCNNKVVATAAAWYREEFEKNAGYLHMVAVDTEYRGLGFSKLVVLKAIEYMKNEGRESVILKTDKFRVAAVNLYEKLGFEYK